MQNDIIVQPQSIIEDRLTDMLHQELYGEDKQQFIINFQLYLAYGNDNKQYVVDLDVIWDWLGFSRKDATYFQGV
jgi:hypothetical protein